MNFGRRTQVHSASRVEQPAHAGRSGRWRGGDVRLLKESILAVIAVLVLVACFMPISSGPKPARWIRLEGGEALLLVAGLVGTWVTLRWLIGLPLPRVVRGRDDNFNGDSNGHGISVPDTSGGDGSD